MKRFEFKWELVGRAGGLGQVEAKDIDDAKQEAKAIIVENRRGLTIEEIDELEITVTELS